MTTGPEHQDDDCLQYASISAIISSIHVCCCLIIWAQHQLMQAHTTIVTCMDNRQPTRPDSTSWLGSRSHTSDEASSINWSAFTSLNCWVNNFSALQTAVSMINDGNSEHKRRFASATCDEISRTHAVGIDSCVHVHMIKCL